MFAGRRLPPLPRVIGEHLDELDESVGSRRDQLIVQIARELRGLAPGWQKLEYARNLSETASKGEASSAALTAAAVTLAGAIRDSHRILEPTRIATAFSEDYLRVAELVRYEAVRLPSADPAVSAAEALLAVRERVLERDGFGVTSMEGKPQTLLPATGRVTLVVFVSTACARFLPTCDRALPDVERIHREWSPKGLALFAVTSDHRDLVDEFLAGETYAVPLYLDPGRKLAEVFGIHANCSFVFDRKGKLVVRAVNIRTERQLRELVKKAGFE